jgi:hypothetical protein
MAKGLGEAEIKALVTRELSLAKTDAAERSKRTTKALEYYQGTMKDIVAEDGRSSVVSRDVADVMGWMLPQLIRVFTASNQMALCEPVGDEDEEFAKQATNGINHVFWKENDGYWVVYDATWDAMLAANGIVKVYWDETPKDVVSYFSGLTDDALTELVSDDAVEVLAHDESQQMVEDPETGQPSPLTVHRVKIKRSVKGGHTCVETIPTEDYGKDGDSKSCATARFQYHRCDKTRSDLIEMGFDKVLVDSIGLATDNNSAEEVARRGGLAHTEGQDKSTEIVDYYEIMLRADVDGDGIAELCRIQFAGTSSSGEILDWEVWEDEQLFYDITYKRMPHRWEGRSAFDETEDVQQVKTVMLRQANDNTYATNNPQRFVAGKVSNPEELFSPSFGGAIFGDSTTQITNLTIPFVANHAYDALNYQDQVIQRRTGVSRQTMALDPEALTNQSATANQNEHDANYSQIELIARNMAHGWAAVMQAILRTEVKHQDAPRTIRMNKKPVKIDPRWWNTDMDVTIDVGLGTGSRDRDAAALQTVLGNQVMVSDRLSVAFPEKALEMLPFVRKTLIKSGESMGIKNIDEFYPEVTQQDIEAGKQQLAQKAQQPDPAIALEQEKQKGAQALAQANGQVTMQVEQGKAQVAAHQAELQANGDVVKNQAELEADMQTAAADREKEITLEQLRQAGEREKIASAERMHAAGLENARLLKAAELEHAAMLEDKRLANARDIAAMKPEPKPAGASA